MSSEWMCFHVLPQMSQQLDLAISNYLAVNFRLLVRQQKSMVSKHPAANM